jgi:hypothetical protein
MNTQLQCFLHKLSLPHTRLELRNYRPMSTRSLTRVCLSRRNGWRRFNSQLTRDRERGAAQSRMIWAQSHNSRSTSFCNACSLVYTYARSVLPVTVWALKCIQSVSILLLRLRAIIEINLVLHLQVDGKLPPGIFHAEF